MKEEGMVELKPCPFCGGRNIKIKLVKRIPEFAGRGYEGFYAVVCDDCCIKGETSKEEDKAIEKWNTRKSDINSFLPVIHEASFGAALVAEIDEGKLVSNEALISALRKIIRALSDVSEEIIEK